MVRAVPEDCGREAGARLVLAWWLLGARLVVVWWLPGGHRSVILRRSGALRFAPCALS